MIVKLICCLSASYAEQIENTKTAPISFGAEFLHFYFISLIRSDFRNQLPYHSNST